MPVNKIRVSPNNTYKGQQKKLVSSVFKKGVVTAVYPANATVDVYFVGNNQTVVRNIPVATNVDINAVAQGDKCRVDLFDETNPNDMVMAYTYGKPQIIRYKTGNASATALGITVAHGLGVIPTLVGLTFRGSGTVFESSAADINNIYLQSDSGTVSVDWYVLNLI